MTLAVEGFANINLANGTHGGSINVTTSGSNRIIVLYVAITMFVQGAKITGVTSTSSLKWKRRSFFSPQGSTAPSPPVRQEVWWAYAPTTVTGETITTVITGTTDSANMSVRAVSGCVDFINPWSRDPTLPGFISSSADALSQITGINTETANTVSFGFWTSGTNQGNPTSLTADTANGYTLDSNLYNPNPSNWNYNVAEWAVNSSQLSNATIAFKGGTSGDNSHQWAMIADALTDQADPGTLYVENIEHLFLPQTSVSGAIDISTLAADRILLLTFTGSDPSVMPEIASVASTSSFVWKLRQKIQSTSTQGPQALETWWAHATSDVDNEVVTATYTGTIDATSLSIKAISGCGNLTAPFDKNGSLPANTVNNTNTGSNTVVINVSTDDPNCLICAAWTANTLQGSPSPLGPDTGYTMDCNLSNPNSTDWNYNVTEYKVIDTTLATDIVLFTGGGSTTNWIMIADAISQLGGSGGTVSFSPIALLMGI